MDFEWEELINGESEIDAEDLNLLAEAIIENENDIKQARTTSEANRTSISRIDDEIENINETLDTQNEKNNEFIKKFSPVIVGRGIGENIYIYDASDASLLGLRVMGKTKQLKSTGRNMIPFPYHDYKKGAGVVEINGITFTINEDGTILVNGTATAEASFFLYRNYDLPSTLPLPVGTYAINSFSTASGIIFQAAIRYNNGEKTIYKQSKGNISITSDMPDASTMSIRIMVYKDRTINNEIIYPMFSSGSDFPEYEPYTNGRLSPSPELPQPMNSAGKDGSIDIEVSNGDGSESQALSIDTPGLRGVPARRDGNYTDENGQQWVCDEIDYDRGVYTKRIYEYEVDIDTVDNMGDYIMAVTNPLPFGTVHTGGLWNMGGHTFSDFPTTDEFYTEGNAAVIETYNGGLLALEGDELLAEIKRIYNGSKMLLIRAEPVEKPLSEEQINAYKGIIMYKPYTTISNDDGAYLRAEYIADTKSYIDNKFAELQKAMLNNI